ncbi:hypothetical protein BS78_06G032200 [Paspalum vaginatum]|nr:hypothetical protein BS78_06G032200 [Paspalum vaginatum]
MAALLLLPLLLLLSSTPLQAQEDIMLGSSLTPQGPNSFWLSPSGDFAFGFRPVIEGNTSYYLLAVWFNKTTDKTVAWYAKTADPDPDPEVVQVSHGARLQLNSKGALSLQDSTGTEVWKSKVQGAAYAAMLDTGNFVLVAADGSTLWGTFDTPTDTILLTQVLTPGMTLRSRIIPTDYSNGRFLLDMESEYVALYLVAVPSGYREDYYWYILGNITKLVFDAAGRVYTAMGNGTNITMTSGVPGSMAEYYHRATLDTDGVFRQYVYLKDSGQWSPPAWATVGFQPPDICQATLSLGSGACGFNSYCKFDGAINQTSCFCPPQYSFIDEDRQYKGCKPNFQPQSCDMGEASAMMQFDLTWENHVDWPLADYETYQPITENQCRNLCLKDCFCAATVYQEATSTCWKKKFPLSNGRMRYDVDRKFLLKLPKSNSSQIDLPKENNRSQTELGISGGKWKKEKTYWILGSSMLSGTSVLVNILLILVLVFSTYRTVTRNEVHVQPLQSSFNNLGLPLKAFVYAELEEATNGFEEVTGTGASGIVYKGQLQDEVRTCIAVKKLDKIQKETEKEFTVEVQAIGQTNHKNLVRLLGFCSEGTERLLVYEFMTNGSLSRFLSGDVRLKWNIRVQLALGIAKGLQYLHEECSTQIIHCDIKPQNILLDDNFTAKISDFGLAKLLRTNQTQTITGIRGTRGYVAPEWFKSSAITAKVDVYSFGVILLELICCRRNVEMEAAEEDRKVLTYWANNCYRYGRVDLLVESDDEAISRLEKVERFVAVALWCLQEDPAIRPTMLKVTQMLDGASAIPTPPDSSSFVRPFP